MGHKFEGLTFSYQSINTAPLSYELQIAMEKFDTYPTLFPSHLTFFPQYLSRKMLIQLSFLFACFFGTLGNSPIFLHNFSCSHSTYSWSLYFTRICLTLFLSINLCAILFSSSSPSFMYMFDLLCLPCLSAFLIFIFTFCILFHSMPIIFSDLFSAPAPG